MGPQNDQSTERDPPDIAALAAEARVLRERLDAIEREIARRREEVRPPAPPTAPPTAPPRGPSASPPPPPPTGYADDRADAVERFVGTRLAAAAGAIVTLIGVAIFVKYAVEEGWLGRLGPLARLAGAYCFAGALIGLGFLAERRIARGASIGLFASGVGSLYAATVVGALFLRVLPPAAAVVALVAVLLIGIVLTVRSGSLVVAITSLVGAYLTPAIVDAYRQEPALLGLHLTIALGLALALSWLRPEPFRVLRFIGLPLHALAAIPWVAGAAPPAVVLIVVAVWWGMVAMECALAAWEGRTPIGNVVGTLLATIFAITVSAPTVAASMAATDPLAYLPAGLAVLACLAGMLLVGPDPDDALSVDDLRIAKAMRVLAVALFTQAAALATLSIGPFLGSGGLALAWSVAAILLVAMPRRLLTANAIERSLLAQLAVWLRGLALLLVIAATLAALVTMFTGAIGGPGVATWPAGSPLAGAIALRADLWAPYAAVLAALAVARTPATGRRGAAFEALVALVAVLVWTHAMAWSTTGHLTAALLAAPAFLFCSGRGRRAGGFVAIAFAGVAWVALVGTEAAADRSPTLVLASVASACAIATALWRLARTGESDESRIGFGIGLLLWCAVVAAMRVGVAVGIAHGAGGEERAVLAAALAVAGVALLAIALRARRAGPLADAAFPAPQVLLLGAATAAWIVASFVAAAEASLHESWRPFRLATGGAMIGAWILARAAITRVATDDQRSRWPIVCIGGIAVSTLWLGSLGIVAFFSVSGWRVIHPVLSAWWAAFAIALLVLGFRGFDERRSAGAALRWAGLVLLGVVALKVITIDLAAASAGWRIVATLLTGLLLVATSVLYVRRAA